MPREKVYCRACHKIIRNRKESIFQHHKECAKELLEAFYGFSEKSNLNSEEYNVVRSLLFFCLTWMNHLRSIIKKVPKTTLEGYISEIEKNFLERNIANDYYILWKEISKIYPTLANALTDLSEVLS